MPLSLSLGRKRLWPRFSNRKVSEEEEEEEEAEAKKRARRRTVAEGKAIFRRFFVGICRITFVYTRPLSKTVSLLLLSK